MTARTARLLLSLPVVARPMDFRGIDKLSYVPLHILDNLPCYSAAAYFHDTKARIRSIR